MNAGRSLALAGALAAALAWPGNVAGQVCWWRTSLERCKVILLTETAVSYPLLNSSGQEWFAKVDPTDSIARTIDAFHPELLWEFGGLLVLDRRTAVGPTYQLGISLDKGEGTKRFGVRVRRQQTRLLSLEANAGVLTGHAGESGGRMYPAGRKQGPSVEVSANLAELISVGLRYDDLAWRDNGPEQRSRYPTGRAHVLSGVVSLGAKPSVPVNLAMGIGVLVLSVLFSGWAG